MNTPRRSVVNELDSATPTKTPTINQKEFALVKSFDALWAAAIYQKTPASTATVNSFEDDQIVAEAPVSLGRAYARRKGPYVAIAAVSLDRAHARRRAADKSAPSETTAPFTTAALKIVKKANLNVVQVNFKPVLALNIVKKASVIEVVKVAEKKIEEAQPVLPLAAVSRNIVRSARVKRSRRSGKENLVPSSQ